jgi:hypothetical protein
MPFINGRYHVNPAMGAALEAAREAEAAMLALQDHAQRNGDDSATESADNSAHASSSPPHAPIHHVEIEATEIVPSHSGRATRGYVARIHRSASQSPAPAGSQASCAYNLSSSPAAAQIHAKPETHVFSNHGDLLNFLHDELSKA